jgi:hypothetical protein
MSYTLHGVLEAKQVRSCSRRIVKLGHRRAALFFKAPWSSLLHSHVGLLRKQQRPNCDSALELEGLEGGLAVFCWTTRHEHQSQQNQQYRQQYQRNQQAMESNSTKKTAKARNQKPKKEKTKIAKEQQPKAKPAEPVASAPSTTPLTAAPPPTADNFGD